MKYICKHCGREGYYINVRVGGWERIYYNINGEFIETVSDRVNKSVYSKRICQNYECQKRID